jgi:hypothetical protein
MQSLNTLIKALETPKVDAPEDSAVRRADETRKESPYVFRPDEPQYAGDEEKGIDGLFGATIAYQKYKKERPRHRLILWMTLNGHKPKEIAAALHFVPQTVYQVMQQPWFQKAFCEISTEMGKDAVETFLQGEIVPTCQKLVEIRDAENAPYAVRKAACDSILDRVRGKPTVHVKQEVTGQIDNVVYDAAALLEEQKRNEQILKSRGIGGN